MTTFLNQSRAGRYAASLAVALALAGCATPPPHGDFVDGRLAGATSSLSREDWSEIVIGTWVQRDPERHGWVRVAATGSMLPGLHAGQVLLIERITFNDLRIGDELIRRAAWNSAGVVLHRVVWSNGRNFITQGDNTADPDPGYGGPADVLWRVAAKLHTNENRMELRTAQQGASRGGREQREKPEAASPGLVTRE